MTKYDIVVIGSGPGGYVAAIRAAQLGFKTACVEKRKTLGGTCLNVGCIPSKALLQSSEHYAFLTHDAPQHGIECKGATLNFQAMQSRKDQIVEGLTGGVAGLLKKNKVASIIGTATFVDPHKIEVADGSNKEIIEADNFIIATGSEPIQLPFLPFDEKQVLSSTGALALKNVPKEMIVIGAGVIGVELASVYNRLGSKVTVIEMLDRICPALDDTAGKSLFQSLKKQGLTFHLQAKVLKGAVSSKGVSLDVELEGKKEQFNGDVVLVAVGRRPYTNGLGLKEIGVTIDARGFISVDGVFRTSQSHIYAIGDVIDGVMLAHRASEEGIAVAELIKGLNPHINYMAIPNVIYTYPEAAVVGMTEKEAKEAGFDTITGTCQLKGNSRARCIGMTDGLVKVVGDKLSGRLLGLHIVAPAASEMIGEGVMAIESKMSVQDVARSSHAHPTVSESIKEACLAAYGQAIHI